MRECETTDTNKCNITFLSRRLKLITFIVVEYTFSMTVSITKGCW